MKKREAWVDNIKILACILVVLGHFFQSMTKSGIIEDNSIYQWFIRTIYYFHVPLFFICSGYLYQKYSRVDTVIGWSKNVVNKFIALGIPYFIFSTLTWILKTVFSSSTNTKVDSLSDALFCNPLSPYWYLYALFFIFAITITLNNKLIAVIYLVLTVAFQIVYFLGFHTGIYPVDIVMQKEIWFVIGMFLVNPCLDNVNKALYGITGGLVFLVLSICPEKILLDNKPGSLVLGLLACFSIISLIKVVSDKKQSKIVQFLSKYTMPIFLMHTLFAAPLRSVLLKLGIDNAVIHIICGLGISFAGPIIAAEILNRVKYLDIIIYPNKYIRVK